MEAMETHTRTAIRDGSISAIRPGGTSITAVNLAAIIGTTRNDKLLRLPPLATIQTPLNLHDLPGIRFSEARLRELTRKRHNESRPIDPHRRQDYFQ